jgi:hypothetical protein
MSISGGVSGSKTSKTEKSQVDPWEPVQPYLKDILGKLGSLGGMPSSGSTEGAMDDYAAFLKGTGADAAKTVSDTGKTILGTPDRTGEVTDAYGSLNKRLSSVADGANQDLGGNTYLQSLLKQVGDDAANRSNAYFAGAGRDFSGANQIETAKGVTQAQLPMLLDQYNREVGRTDAAARDLFGAGQGAAVAKTGMDVSRAGVLGKGAELTKDGANMGASGQQALIDLLMGKDKLPYEKLGWLTELLYPMAGFGSQSEGTASQKGSQWGLSGTAKVY